MAYPTGFESGALTIEVNGLVLYTDNTQKLAEMRDNIYKESGAETSPLITFCQKAIEMYNRETDSKLELSVAQRKDFVDIYVRDYDNWCYENISAVSSSSEPVLEVLQNCIVDGMIVRLPPKQLERSLYNDVKDKLEKIGGKWKGGKVQGFVFTHDPADLLNQVASGANRNLKKEFQAFFTPEDTADHMVELLQIEDGDLILEPEAGSGNLVHAIQRKHACNNIDVCELNPVHRKELEAIHGVTFLMDDFMGMGEIHYNHYDKIIANPPFSNNQDIDHIRQMWLMVKPGGRIVTVASKGWTFNSKKKPTEFREWLDTIDAEIIFNDGGKFKESGTMVETVIVVINKPKVKAAPLPHYKGQTRLSL